MNQKRKRIPESGDVVLLDFPGVKQTKRRPAVIVSSALYHQQRTDVVVGLITSQIAGATAATDHILRDWHHVGLRQPSAYKTFLTTVPRSAISRRIGKLSNRDWRSVLKCLQLALVWRPS